MKKREVKSLINRIEKSVNLLVEPDEDLKRELEMAFDRFRNEVKPKDDSKQSNELHYKGLDAAVRYLELRGYEVLETEWECRFGTIELVAKDADGTLCFIKVKTHQGTESGLPSEEMCQDRQAQLEKIALCYLMESDAWSDQDDVRFDSIGICVAEPHKALLRHHRKCFDGLCL